MPSLRSSKKQSTPSQGATRAMTRDRAAAQVDTQEEQDDVVVVADEVHDPTQPITSEEMRALLEQIQAMNQRLAVQHEQLRSQALQLAAKDRGEQPFLDPLDPLEPSEPDVSRQRRAASLLSHAPAADASSSSNIYDEFWMDAGMSTAAPPSVTSDDASLAVTNVPRTANAPRSPVVVKVRRAKKNSGNTNEEKNLDNQISIELRDEEKRLFVAKGAKWCFAPGVFFSDPLNQVMANDLKAKLRQLFLPAEVLDPHMTGAAAAAHARKMESVISKKVRNRFNNQKRKATLNWTPEQKAKEKKRTRILSRSQVVLIYH
ncbi:hypothetical protein BC940DRAFT_318496 [Gongronella butleri]|nr:hypothetical protein BC940DRAFT_318496 [Gongronella butleri]